MSLISTPLGDGRHRVEVDFPYYLTKGKAEYYQTRNQATAKADAERHADWFRNRYREDVKVIHNPDKQNFVVESIGKFSTS
jgi:hypothetical protein